MTKLMTKMNQSIQFHNEVSSVGCSNFPFRGHLNWHAFAGYLFVISNGSKSIKTNVLLDTGSGATFVTCDISQTRVCDMRYIIETRLKRGNTTNISFQCFIKQDTFTSKLVNSEISMSNPTSVRSKTHGLLIQRINTDNFKNCYNHLADIYFTQFDRTTEIQ